MAAPGTVAQLTAPNAAVTIEADDYDAANDDDDTTSISTSVASETTSLASTARSYTYENGRRYHAYRPGSYPLPNDEAEQDRLDLHHHVFRLTLSGALFRAPISNNSVRRALDMGTGTGLWAIDFADEFPGATVIGTDLSPIQPSWVPPNARFYIDDLESDWCFGEDEGGSGDFDFIHGRGLAGSIGDWGKLYRQAFANLRPGGWLEVQEHEGRLASDDGSLERAPFLRRWEAVMDEASTRFGKRFDVADRQKELLRAAGFADVRDDVRKVPVGPWPRDPRLKELGRFQREQMVLCVEPFTLALLTRVMGWTADETRRLMDGVRRELRDPSLHTYSRFHFVYGRKPEV